MSNLPTTQGAWGTEGLSSKDLVLHKIQIAQAMSDACKEGIARPGDIIHSATKAVLAGKGEKIEVLPILCFGSWIVSTAGMQPKFMRKEPLTVDPGDDWKLETFDDDGTAIVKQKCLTFLVLPVNNVSGFPLYLDFQKTNKNGGKLLSTIMQENAFKGLPGPARVIELSTILRSFNNNTWSVYNLAPSRAATEEELTQCKTWFERFKANSLKEEEKDNGIN